MTTKAIIEELNCKKEEAPQKSLEKVCEILKTAPDVQARIKNMVVTGVHINGDDDSATVTLDFESLDLVSSDPTERLRQAFIKATEAVLRKLKEADNKEESHD